MMLVVIGMMVCMMVTRVVMMKMIGMMLMEMKMVIEMMMMVMMPTQTGHHVSRCLPVSLCRPTGRL